VALLDLLATNTVWLLTVTALLGLLVGSFLNVVIHRLPLIMDRDWRGQCAEYLERPELAPADDTVTLARPRSRCPHCGHAITALENIPVLSYLWLRGKCSDCGARISPRYPIVEIVTALLSLAVAWHFGFGWPLAGGLLLTWALTDTTSLWRFAMVRTCSATWQRGKQAVTKWSPPTAWFLSMRAPTSCRNWPTFKAAASLVPLQASTAARQSTHT